MNGRHRLSGPSSAVALLVYVVLAVAIFWNIWVDPGGRWVGEEKDPQLFLWYLGHLPVQISHGANPFFSTDLNFPDGVNLMWNSSILLPALLLWPVTAVLGLVVAYNVLLTLAVALSAWIASLAARLFLSNRVLCFLAGLIYGFSPAIMAQATRHAHVVIAVFPPLLLLLAWEIVVRQRWPALMVGALTGLASALQLVTGEEILVLTAIVGVIGIGLAAGMHPKQWAPKSRYAIQAVIAALAVFLLLSAYPLWFQFLGPQRVFGQLQPADRYVNDLLAFVIPNHTLLQNGTTRAILNHFTGNPSEDDAYLGIALLGLFVLGMVVAWRRPAIRWLSLLTVITAILSLGPHLHVAGSTTAIPLPWLLVGGLPLFRNIVPDRFMLLGFFGIAVVIAALLEERRRSPVPWQRRAVIAATAVGLLLIVPESPFVSTAANAPAFFKTESSTVPGGSAALVTPFSDSQSTTAMYWQALSGYRFRMPEGDVFSAGPFLGPKPSYLETVINALDQGKTVDSTAPARERALRDLFRWHIETVIVGPSPGRDAIVAYFTSLLDAAPVSTGGVAVWSHCCPAPAASSA